MHYLANRHRYNASDTTIMDAGLLFRKRVTLKTLHGVQYVQRTIRSARQIPMYGAVYWTRKAPRRHLTGLMTGGLACWSVQPLGPCARSLSRLT